MTAYEKLLEEARSEPKPYNQEKALREQEKQRREQEKQRTIENLKEGDRVTLDASTGRTEGTHDWEVRAIIDGGRLYALRTAYRSLTGGEPTTAYQGLTAEQLKRELA